MIDPARIRSQNEALSQLAGEKFSFRSKGLKRSMRKIGRRLPKRIHNQADKLIEAELLAGHPKLSMMLDEKALAQAEREIREALEVIDPKDRRTGAILSALGGVSINIIAVLVLLVLVLWWRGFV